MRRKISLWVVLLFAWILIVLMILFGWSVWHIDRGGQRFGVFSKTIITIAQFPSLINETAIQLSQNPLFLNDKYPNVKSIRSNNSLADDGYILLSSYDKEYKQTAVNLIRLSDLKNLHTWILSLQNQKKGYTFFAKDDNRDLRMLHPLLLKDGSIIFQYFVSSLISIDLHSNIQWVLKGRFHHSKELDVDENIWVPIKIDSSKSRAPILNFLENDALGKVSKTGKLLYQKSVAEILIENGYRGLLFGTGSINADPIHLNDIQPALTTTKYWNRGDLLVSIRHRSTVFLYRPTTNKIIWLKTGPWLNQHDVDFIDSTRIGVFGNDLVASRISHHPDFLINGHNEEYIYDFATDKISTPYTEFLSSSKVGTLSEGRSDVLENGDLFVEETNFGRLLRGNKKHEIWSLVDRIDKKTISMLSWCRYISKEEFEQKYSKINFNSNY